MSDFEKGAAPQRMRVVDDAGAPIVYVDGCLGGGPNGPNLTLTFGARAVDHTHEPPHPYLVTNLRLMIPVDAARSLADFINSLLAEMTPPADSTIQ